MKHNLVVFLVIAALPLLSIPPWFSPPDWGKTIVFRMIFSLLLFLFTFQLLSQRRVRIRNPFQGSWKENLPFWLLLALLLISLFSTLLSLDKTFSLWGDPPRSGGFINFAFYIIFAIFALLIFQQREWQRILDFSIVIGILVSSIALIQQFHIPFKLEFHLPWSDFPLQISFIHSDNRPPSTIGGPIFLGMYLLLLSCVGLALGIQAKNLVRKLLYTLSLIFFISTAIFITQSRAVMVGLGISILWFFFLYPQRLLFPKILFAILLLLGIGGTYMTVQIPKIAETQPKIITDTARRIVSIPQGEQSRVSAWRVSWNAIKDKPILGYGPENFSIGFDKYYDPSFPQFNRRPDGVITTWWDRAHNILLDLGVQAGVFAVATYLALFGALLWTLQRVKKQLPEKAVIAHGLQAGFIGYFVANLFSFDTFSTYLIFFLMVGYTMYLTSFLEKKSQIPMTNGKTSSKFKIQNSKLQLKSQKFLSIHFLSKWRWPILGVSFVCLVWFLWQYNIKPFQINAQINRAKFLAEHQRCDLAIQNMEDALKRGSTFLDVYLRIKYVDYLKQCEEQRPEKRLEYAQKGYELLKKNIAIRPYSVRNWILLGGFTNVLIETAQVRSESPERIEELKREATQYFEKAHELSPKRQEVYIEWIKNDLVVGEYQRAKEKAQECINLNEKLTDCWWLKGVAEIFLKEFQDAQQDINEATQRGYDVINSLTSLHQLARAYTASQHYPRLRDIYERLTQLRPYEPQYHASFAMVYKKLREYNNARAEALKVLELQPEAKEEVEKFLEELL